MTTNFNNFFKYLAIFLALLLLPFIAQAQSLFVELGGVWQHRNDTQIPPDSGTRFEIDRFDQGPFFHYRAEGYYRLDETHGLRLVFAPASFEVSGRSDQAVTFDDEVFPSSEDLTIKYQFNSYRLTYTYALRGYGEEQLNLGFTGKVRDANITFKQGSRQSSYKNIGFVPLFYFEYQTLVADKLLFNFNIDGSAAPQGRAFDAAFKLRYNFSDNFTGALGFRTLEGGADNDKVFAYSWFNYGVFEVGYGF